MTSTQLAALGVVEAGRRLVHEQELRLHGDGAPDADPPFVTERQGIDAAVRLVAARSSQSRISRRRARAGRTLDAHARCAPASIFSMTR